MYPSPYWTPQIEPSGIPGGMLGQFAYNTAISQAQANQLIPRVDPLYLGDNPPYIALQNRRYAQQQEAIMMEMAKAQSIEAAQLAAGFMRLSGREPTEELQRAFERAASIGLPAITPFLAQTESGRGMLDFVAGGISPVNIGMAMHHVGQRMQDPGTGDYRMTQPTVVTMTNMVTELLREAPTDSYGDQLGPRRSRGFSGQEIGNIMSLMQMRGEMPAMDAVTDLLTDPVLQRAYDAGLITGEDIRQFGVDPDGRVARLVEAGRLTELDAQSFTGRAVSRLMSSHPDLALLGDRGIRSEEDLEAYRRQFDETEMIEQVAQQQRAARLQARHDDEVRARDLARYSTYDEADQESIEEAYESVLELDREDFDHRLLERMAIEGRRFALTDGDAANDLNAALAAARAGDEEAFNETAFSKLSQREKLEIAADITGTNQDAIAHDVANLNSTLLNDIAGGNNKNPFAVPDIEQEALDNLAELDVVRQYAVKDAAMRATKAIEGRLASLSAVRDILKDEGLAANEEAMFELLGELTNYSTNQMSGHQAERIVRQLETSANRIGYGIEELRAVSQIGAQTAEAMDMERPMGALITQEILTARQNYAEAGINNIGIYGMANADQAARAVGNVVASGIDSEEGRFLATVSRYARRPGTEIDTDTEEGRQIATLIQDARAGRLSGESAEFMEKSRHERLQIASRVLGEAPQIIESATQDSTANEAEILKTNMQAAVFDASARDYFDNQLVTEIAKPSEQYLRSKGLGSDVDVRALSGIIARSSSEAYENMSTTALRNDTVMQEQLAAENVAAVQQAAEEGNEAAIALLDRHNNNTANLKTFFKRMNAHTAERVKETADASPREVALLYGRAAREAKLEIEQTNRQEAFIGSLLSDQQQGRLGAAETLLTLGKSAEAEGRTAVEVIGEAFGHDLSGETLQRIADATSQLEEIDQSFLMDGLDLNDLSDDSGVKEVLAARDKGRDQILKQLREELAETADFQDIDKKFQQAALRPEGAGEALDAAAKAKSESDGNFDTINMDNVTIVIDGETVVENARGTAKPRSGWSHTQGG